MMSRDPYLYAPSHVQEERYKQNMKNDPIEYAKEKLLNIIDEVDEINDLANRIKILIKVYFSDEVQRDETPMGAMRRNQIRKELLDFANK